MSFFPRSQNTPKSMSAGASPRTLLGSLQRSSDSLAGFEGAASRQKGNGREGRTKGRGTGGEKGKIWGIAPWLLGHGCCPWYIVSQWTITTLTRCVKGVQILD